MHDLSSFIYAERVAVKHLERFKERGAHARPHPTAPHPVRTWIGHRLISLGGALAGASPAFSRPALTASRETHPVRSVA